MSAYSGVYGNDINLKVARSRAAALIKQQNMGLPKAKTIRYKARSAKHGKPLVGGGGFLAKRLGTLFARYYGYGVFSVG